MPALNSAADALLTALAAALASVGSPWANAPLQCLKDKGLAHGRVPHLRGVLPPSVYLPRGALLVEEIIGRTATLPGGLGRFVPALASIHALPLPA